MYTEFFYLRSAKIQPKPLFIELIFNVLACYISLTQPPTYMSHFMTHSQPCRHFSVFIHCLTRRFSSLVHRFARHFSSLIQRISRHFS